jgi:hypothetical protein
MAFGNSSRKFNLVDPGSRRERERERERVLWVPSKGGDLCSDSINVSIYKIIYIYRSILIRQI